VDTVGDVGDGDVRLGDVRPDALPHPPRHGAVQSADRIGVGRETDGQDRHAERFRFVAGILAAQTHQILEG